MNMIPMDNTGITSEMVRDFTAIIFHMKLTISTEFLYLDHLKKRNGNAQVIKMNNLQPSLHHS